MTASEVGTALSTSADKRGEALLEIPEDQWFDRKSARIKPQDLAKTLASFANAEGGVVVVGLAKGKVEGAGGDKARINDQMQAGFDFCQPSVRADVREVECIADGRADRLLVFEVSPSEAVHATNRDEVYLRVGDENRKLTFHERRELEYDKGQAQYEVEVAHGTGWSDLEEGMVAEYAKAVGAKEPSRLMAARGLMSGDQLTIAGYLLFGRYPQDRLPEAYVRVLRYRGTERGAGSRQQLVDDRKFEGSIPDQIFTARGAVRELQPTRHALGESGRFEDIPLVPEDAWLEGLVNAVVHRSYSMAGDHIRFEIFDDRIEIHSPGRFPGLVDLADPLHTTRFARNPRIARVCADLNYGQELGEGIRRMFEEMRHAGLSDPLYRQTSGSVCLTLSTEPVDRELDSRLPGNSREVVSALRQAGRLGTGELAEAAELSRPTARKVLDSLTEAGVVEWVGKSSTDPRAYWQLRRPT